MGREYRVFFERGDGENISALKGLGVWAGMIEFLRERDPELKRVSAYNWNLQRLNWDASSWGPTASEPAMVAFRSKGDSDAFALAFGEHIRSIRRSE